METREVKVYVEWREYVFSAYISRIKEIMLSKTWKTVVEDGIPTLFFQGVDGVWYNEHKLVVVEEFINECM